MPNEDSINQIESQKALNDSKNRLNKFKNTLNYDQIRTRNRVENKLHSLRN